MRRQAEKEKARRLKQEERNRKRAEEAKKRQEEARIREEKRQLRRRGRSGSRKVPPNLKPYNPTNEAAGGHYFGLPLLEVCSVDNPIPVYVEQCARIIEEQGIKQLGIYRVSGKKDDVLELHAKFDEGNGIDILMSYYQYGSQILRWTLLHRTYVSMN